MKKLNNIEALKIFSIFITVILYCFYILTVDFKLIEPGYRITIFMPIVFIFCFYIFLWKPIFQKRSPFLVLFTIVAFIRYVVLSIVTINNGTYIGISGVQPQSQSLTFAAILMIWELILASIFISYWSKRKLQFTATGKKVITSQANPLIYVIFILFIGSLVILIPQSRQGLSFFGEVSYAVRDEIGSLLILGIREAFINAKYFLLFAAIIFLQGRKNLNFAKNKFFSYIAILAVCIIIIGIRVGANRKKMISDSMAVLLLLWKLFPKYKKTTAALISSIGFILVALTTVFRGMTESVGNFFGEYFGLDFLQPYLLGQYNVAIAIESTNFFPNMIDYKTYLFSFLRPLFGIGSFVKDFDYTTVSSLFDKRMSLGIVGFRGDQILPMIGEGYALFGLVLSPILLVITIRIGIYFDSLYLKSKKLEVVFIASLISFYLAQGMILNSTILINMLSFKLAIYAPIVFLAYQLKRKKIGGKSKKI